MKYINKQFKGFFESLNKPKYQTLFLDSTKDLNAYLIKEVFLSREEHIFVVAENIYNAQKMYDALVRELDEDSVNFFPADEVVSVEMLAASNEFRTARLQTIVDLVIGKRKIIVTHTLGYLRKEASLKKWQDFSFDFKVGSIIEKADFVKQLFDMGYKREYQVEKPGDFSVRGFIVDVFPMTEETPVRIEFFDDEIDSLRTFDVVTQRSSSTVEEIRIYPMYELFFTDEEKSKLIETISNRELTDKLKLDIEALESNNDLDRLHKYMQYIDHSGITDFVDDKIVFLTNPKRVKDVFNNAVVDVTEWYLNQDDYSGLSFEFFNNLDLALAKDEKVIYLQNVLTSDYKYDFSFKSNATDIVDYVGNTDLFINDIKKSKETILLPNEKGIISLLEDKEIPFVRVGSKDDCVDGSINVISNQSNLSFRVIDQFQVIASEKIFKRIEVKKKHFKLKEASKVKSLKDIKPGDYVVHYDYGIGKYLGVKSVELDNRSNDYIHIAYRNDEVLYVPVENINLIQKYSAREGAKPKINSIGGTSWAKTKAKVKKKLKDIAGKLIKLYAERKQAEGYAYPKDDEDQFTFEADFPYSETVDQLKAIEDVKKDMEATYPMDRLLCGDVGYGKTEVAMRAAFKAVYAGKQVAYLCPTTVLSRQHYKSFKARFSKYGIRVELLNRFVPKRHMSQVLAGLQSGEVDIVIGTHRILSKDIVYKDLGLLIVDEEQRFGVEHKERIKEIKINVDVLTLTATPIPRTLQMALMGVKSTSLLETPPANRYPVQTYVIEENKTIMKDAIERELSRDGQVFVLYNKVSDIHLLTNKIQRLVPDASVTFAHGQMSRDELENTMNDFVDKVYNVLVCTTIIETGIDIPNANTLIITDANRLGLAQLYQIRGRVGRSDRIAYAYLMYKHANITETAEKRLSVIKEFTELGSGFKIAMRDLSIRGAGDVLGAEQSGFIDSVGIDLYMQMLEEEIQEQQGTPVPKPETTKQSVIKISKHIPDEYVSDEAIKIDIHRKIKNVKNSKDIDDLIVEMKDKYGRVPMNLVEFMYKTIFDKYAQLYEVDQIEDKNNYISLRLSRKASLVIDGETLLMAAYKVSKDIDLSFKNSRVFIVLKNKKDYLKVLVDLFEYLINAN